MVGRKVRRGRGPLVVLMYHAVADTSSDPFDLAVPPEQFADHVAMLARSFELVEADAIRTPSAAMRVAITFDDGYVDNLEVAAPVLAAAGAPAAFFVNTPRPGPRDAWWDEIVHALEAEPPCEFLEVDVGRRIAIDVRTPDGRAQAVQKLGVHLETMTAPAIAAVLDSAYEQLGYEPAPCARHRRLRDDELLELRALGRFEIGGHTPNHLALASLDDHTAMAEITASFDHLTGLLGAPPASFAYPFGSVGHAITPAHARLVERAGFRQAFTTQSAEVGRLFDPFLVPRVQAMAIDADELHASITHAMGR